MRAPRISLAIPTHDMRNSDYFLQRLQDSIEMQTFRDFEVVVTADGKMAENTNSAMSRCRGDFIKILYMDDYLAHEDSLKEVADSLDDSTMLLATGCTHKKNGVSFQDEHHPEYSQDIHRGNNTIGAPSVITVRNRGHLWFDENLSWLLDCDFYKRYYDAYGPPKLLRTVNVVLGIGKHQMTQILDEEFKLAEYQYLKNKYE